MSMIKKQCDSVCWDTEVLKTGGDGTIIVLNNFTYTLMPNVTFTQSWLSSLFLLLGRLLLILEIWGLILCYPGACSCWSWVSVAKSPNTSGYFLGAFSRQFPFFLFYKPAFLHLNICRNTCDLPLNWEVCLMVCHMPFFVVGFSHVTLV